MSLKMKGTITSKKLDLANAYEQKLGECAEDIVLIVFIKGY